MAHPKDVGIVSVYGHLKVLVVNVSCQLLDFSLIVRDGWTLHIAKLLRPRFLRFSDIGCGSILDCRLHDVIVGHAHESAASQNAVNKLNVASKGSNTITLVANAMTHIDNGTVDSLSMTSCGGSLRYIYSRASTKAKAKAKGRMYTHRNYLRYMQLRDRRWMIEVCKKQR